MATDLTEIQELLQDAPFVALQLGPDEHITAWNTAAASLFGVTSEAAVGRRIAAVVPVPGGDAAWHALLAEGRGGRRLWMTRRDGRPDITCEWTLRPLAGGGAVVYGQPAVPEVDTSQRRVHDLLLRTLLDNLDIVAWMTDMDGTALLMDGRGLARAGLTPGMLVGKNLVELYGTRNPAFLAGLQGKASHYFSPEHGGHFENWSIPLHDEHGRQIALAGVSLDVTPAKQREEELQRKLDVIERQQQALREMSTPIIEVWDQVICLPIVGLVDTVRAADVMDALLHAVTRTRARFAILDLTGVDVVDTSTASHLLGLIRAIRLLGAEGVLTGVHPNIAQTVVTLGVDLTGLIVRATLRDALKYVLTALARR
jgi:rsbT co-antagonist protein RsbR